MKQSFFLIEDLNVYINLYYLTSFKLEAPLKGFKEKCCIVVGPSTIYWCDAENFNILEKLLS